MRYQHDPASAYPCRCRHCQRERVARRDNLARAAYQRHCGAYARLHRHFRALCRLRGLAGPRLTAAQCREHERLWVYFANLSRPRRVAP